MSSLLTNENGGRNPSAATNPAITSRCHAVGRWRRFVDRNRSPKTRAERAKLKSCKDDKIIAQGKRGTSAALGKEAKNDLLSFFQSGLARHRRAKPDWKKERLGVGWRLPRAAAARLHPITAWLAAALPWADICCPFRAPDAR